MSYLTAPAVPPTDFQVLWNGLLMGAGTPYGLPPVWQFLDLAPIKTMDVARVWGDGSWSGPDFADVATPAMDVEIQTPDSVSFAAAVKAFVNAFGVQKYAAPLWVKLPGLDLMGIPAKTNKRVVPIDITWGQLSIASVQFRMPNPIWQSAPRSIVLTASGTGTSGLVFPMFSYAYATYASPSSGADFGLTTAGSSAGILTNSGNADAWPVVVLSGTGAGPASIVIDGHTVTYGDTIPVGQTVTIDYATGTATLTGGVDRTGKLTARDFTPVTSTSTANLVAANGTATITIADRRS